jgi:hypothetical protein
MKRRSFSCVLVSSLLLAGTALADTVFTAKTTSMVNLSGASTTILGGEQEILEYVAYAKVIVENNSTGPRSVQCRLGTAGPHQDLANTALGAGESETLSLIMAKPGNLDVAPFVSCFVFSSDKTGVKAGHATIAQHYGSVAP